MADLIAVDIGNARIKLGLFRGNDREGLPEPEATLHLSGVATEFGELAAWLEKAVAVASTRACVPSPPAPLPQAGEGRVAWYIGSVNRPAASRLIDWVREHRPGDPITLLAADDVPLTVELERPDMVGVDRLLDALAANRLRDAGRPAVVVDVGTAITVDLVSADGVFRGGAILPGIAMSARALHEFTDLLPLIEMSDLLTAPPALGKATVPAMQSGLFWGAVGSIRELVARLSDGAAADLFLTGGAGPVVAALLGPSARHVPHLTLAGIAIAAGGRP